MKNKTSYFDVMVGFHSINYFFYADDASFVTAGLIRYSLEKRAGVSKAL
jgi:hypothetical protein